MTLFNEILSMGCTLYLIYAFVMTKKEAQKRKHEYTIETVIAELKRENLEQLKKIKQEINADSRLYIDRNINRVTTRIVETVKRIIKENEA